MLRLLGAVACCFVAAGCATNSRVTLPALPNWQPVPAGEHSALAVAIAARRQFPGVPVNAADATYTLVSRAWLDDYVAWTWAAGRAAGIAYTPESFDCDDFALGFAFFANRAAAKANVHAAPLIARLVVELSPGRRHMLVGVATDRGLVVVEPQTSAGPFRVTPLSEYGPRILSITFGDFNP
jgi:hypothetical protein